MNMVSNEHLERLFQAYKEHNDQAFYKIAEAIIAEALAANHHSLAKNLKRALSDTKGFSKGAEQLSALPKDRRRGDELIHLQESFVDPTKIVLSREPKEKIDRILDEHRNRLKLARYGYSPKSKILFWGEPGCGKTYTAHYIAYELGLPIGVLRISTVLSSFLGDTSTNLQKVFDLARKNPMVLLLDEVDAVGKNRDDSNDVGELKRVVNSFLQMMDEFYSAGSLLIAASNHQYLLDPALWRRFDEIIHFPPPSQKERYHYLSMLLNSVDFDGSVNNISRELVKLSYADINKIIIESIKTMIIEDRTCISSSEVLDKYRHFLQDLSSAQSKNGINKKK